MKVAIISDIHNNITNLQKVLSYCKNNKIEKIICCGDLASMETLDFLNDNFSGEIFYCFGNMDDGQMTNKTCHPEQAERVEGSNKSKKLDSSASVGMTCHYKNTWIFRDYGTARIDNKNIAFTHYPEAARELCESGKYDFVFYGHTHKPWSSFAEATDGQGGKCMMLNPGNVAGEIYPPTFAVWNTENDKFELIRIHDLK